MTEDDLKTLLVARHDLVLQVLPQLGGKISWLRWNGREVPARIPRKPFRQSINLGGLPVGSLGQDNLGIESCNDYPDWLDVTIERGDCVTMPSHSALKLEWRLFVGQRDDWERELERLEGLL
ncbi:MAG: hypothetical protein IT319_10640 [Anaerolineae bacterium]|nr:hypothetical protein [Anaerolineae bacterium]